MKTDVFRAFLEFLYTGHVTLDLNIALDLLILSNRFRVMRLLSWCEYSMSKVVEKAIEQSIAKSELDIIGLLLLAQKHNANQLAGFLLHFISTNYGPMQRRKEWVLLKGKLTTCAPSLSLARFCLLLGRYPLGFEHL